jgi:2Fe-2S ferredoxin
MMIRVIYVQPDGRSSTVELGEGTSVMQGAMMRAVPGIRAECGGGCACATCHVYVDDTWLARVPPADPMEADMLEGVAAERRANSRLSCQIVLSSALDGLVVHLPERQE